MFDIGFWELSLIGIVALLVIGPERLPAVARTVGKYVGKANRFIANIKDDINKELKDEDLKRILEEQQKLADEYKNAASAANSAISSETESLRESVVVDDLLEIQEQDESDKASVTLNKSTDNRSQSSAEKQAQSPQMTSANTGTDPDSDPDNQNQSNRSNAS